MSFCKLLVDAVVSSSLFVGLKSKFINYFTTFFGVLCWLGKEVYLELEGCFNKDNLSDISWLL